MPMTIGNRNNVLAFVNKDVLGNNDEALADDGLEEKTLNAVSAEIKTLYTEFKSAIAAGKLMDAEGKSANDLYEILSKEESLKAIHDLMRRTLAVALQDQIQEEKNQLLKSLLSE